LPVSRRQRVIPCQQSGVSRCFAYDSLSRLSWATNPESGTISYGYDANGNLTLKTDARSITTTLVYDQLSRLHQKSYSDGTPSATYSYGTATSSCPSPLSADTSYAWGRLISVSNSVSSYAYDCYDGLGRLLHGSQTTNSQNYPFTYVYNAAGSVKSMTYPSGRQVTYTYDNDDRATSVTNVATNTLYATVPSPSGYAANGSISSLTLGNNIVESTTYDYRFRPTDINAKLGTTTLLDLSYYYCTGADARPSCFAASPDSFNFKFTSKERDAESGLDYFGARYFSGAQGRFTSPDRPFNDQDPSDPQSWNLFSYGRNNPLLYTDPTGNEVTCSGDADNFKCVDNAPPAQPPQVDTQMSTLGELSYLFITTVTTTAQQAQQVLLPAVDWFTQPRNPLCMAGYMGTGATIGTWAGGTAGLAGGPLAEVTIPGGAAGGAALGGGIGGLGGMIMCSQGTWGGSGGGKGGDYREKTTGANAKDAQNIRDAAREVGVDRNAFGKYVEKMKKLEGRGASENFGFDELLGLAREFKAGSR
jgi:RHS repeat-associated protein